MSADLEGRAFTKKGRTLVPSDFAAEEMLADLPEGREVLITIRRARSVQHHRFFFSMLRLVVSNTDRWQTEDDLLDDLKLATGHVRRRACGITGKPLIIPDSINFASMPQDPFRRFVNRCVYVLSQALGWNPEDLMRETEATQRRVSDKAPLVPDEETQERVDA